MNNAPIRVLVAKPGLDGHDRGAKVVARGLRDAGMEVIYTGLHRSPAQIAEAALQEDAQVIGLSVLSDAHGTLVPKIVAALNERGMDDVLMVIGGIIPDADIPDLEAGGVAKVFGPGSRVEDIVGYIRANVPSR